MWVLPTLTFPLLETSWEGTANNNLFQIKQIQILTCFKYKL